MFYDNFVKLCNSVNKSPSAVVLEIGLQKSTVTRWKNGSIPTDATAQRIADYFGISTVELMSEQKEKLITNESNELENVYFDLAKDAQRNKIDPEDIKAAIDMIKRLRNKQ